jgi:hypothetical protein
LALAFEALFRTVFLLCGRKKSVMGDGAADGRLVRDVDDGTSSGGFMESRAMVRSRRWRMIVEGQPSNGCGLYVAFNKCGAC